MLSPSFVGLIKHQAIELGQGKQQLNLGLGKLHRTRDLVRGHRVREPTCVSDHKIIFVAACNIADPFDKIFLYGEDY
jgi:hypothetical protein